MRRPIIAFLTLLLSLLQPASIAAAQVCAGGVWSARADAAAGHAHHLAAAGASHGEDAAADEGAPDTEHEEGGCPMAMACGSPAVAAVTSDGTPGTRDPGQQFSLRSLHSTAAPRIDPPPPRA